MKGLNVISAICLLFFCMCSKQGGLDSRYLMDRAETIMNAYPDSAFSYLERIDTTYLSSAKKARLSLLKSIAIDKMFKDTTDVSIIKPAVNYYCNHGTTEEQMKAMYYLGRIQFNACDYTSALISFIKAKELSEQTDDDRMKGMICSFLGSTQCQNYNNKDELNYYKEAYYWFQNTGKQPDIDNARYLLTVGYHNNRLFNQSDSIAKTISKDSRFYKLGVLVQASNAITQSKDSANKALGLFNNARVMGADFSLDNWYQYAYSLLLTGQSDACNRLLNQLNQYPSDVKSGWWKYAIAVNHGDTQQAFAYLEAYSHQRDSLVRARFGQSLHKAEADYYLAQKERVNHKLTQAKALVAVLSLIATIVLLVLILFYQKKQINLKTENNEILQKYIEVQRLLNQEKLNSEGLEDKEKLINGLQLSFAQMYKARFAKVGDLIGTNLDLALNLDRGQSLFKQRLSEILSEISKSVNDSTAWEKRVNHDIDNILNKLRIDYPSFTENDLLLLSFVIVGFGSTRIATILNANSDTIRSRKKRLKDKIFAKTTDNTPLYRAFIN